MTDRQSATDALASVRALINGPESFRVEFGTSFSLRSGDEFASARFFRQQGKRWVKVGPVIAPPEHGGRRDLIEMLLRLADTDGAS